jgi:hypothetical protein
VGKEDALIKYLTTLILVFFLSGCSGSNYHFKQYINAVESEAIEKCENDKTGQCYFREKFLNYGIRSQHLKYETDSLRGLVGNYRNMFLNESYRIEKDKKIKF